MAVYVVTPKTGLIRNACEKSLHLCMVTDAASPAAIPENVRAATDELRTHAISFETPNGADRHIDATLAWMSGDELLRGNAADIRRAMYSRTPLHAGVVVHLPCFEEADFLSVQPRILRRDATQMRLNTSLHITGTAAPSPAARAACDHTRSPWARLYSTLLLETKRPGASLDRLKELWQLPNLPPPLAALILRNMILVLIRCDDFAKAEELLTLGGKAFTGYAEIPYLHAILWLKQKKPAKAISHLEAALGLPETGFICSGGTHSYRAFYLLGAICAGIGELEKAAQYWRSSLLERPAFAPSVRGLLDLQMPRARALEYAWPIAEVARREPQFLEGAVNFMLQHDLPANARLLLSTMPIEPALRERMEAATEQCERRLRPRPAAPKEQPGIRFTGPFMDASGHARINCAVGASLLASRDLDVAIDPSGWPTLLLANVGNRRHVLPGIGRHPNSLDLTIRHLWPPDFLRPRGGKLACILPWEHATVPRGWVSDIEANVDELWVPSEFVRRAFVEGGVSAERVHVLPNGLDAAAFQPLGSVSRPPTARGFVFLYVGGAIRRKGIDLLLRAYGDAFTAEDDVTLIVKDVGSRSFYAHNTRLGEVIEFKWRSSAPHTHLLTEELSDESLAALYRGADAFVLPYRGEGFGMPIVEAMACGTPAIVTGAGPALEFCTPEDSYFVPAREVPVPEPPPPLGEFSGPWTWFEPDVVSLALTMRHVYEHREEAQQRGKLASEKTLRNLAWEKILPLYHARIAALTAGGS